MEELITLHLYAEDYDSLKSWQLATWCKKRGANEWTLAEVRVKRAETTLFERFEELTQHFRLPQTKKRRSLYYGRAAGPNSFIRPTPLWRLTSASLAVIQEFLPDGLFTNKGGKEVGFEDPIFYRNGEFMLGVVSHEKEGILRVTQTERGMLEAEGFPFRPFGTYVGY